MCHLKFQNDKNALLYSFTIFISSTKDDKQKYENLQYSNYWFTEYKVKRLNLKIFPRTHSLLLHFQKNFYIDQYCHVISHGDDRNKINTILPLEWTVATRQKKWPLRM